jgi:hypothetical protein
MFLRRRLKKMHVFGAFYLDEVFGAFEGEEGGVTRTLPLIIICTRVDQENE